MKILVTDCFTRKSFDIYNILKRHYNKSNILLASSSNNKLKEQITYKRNILHLNKNNQQSFSENLLNISRSFQNEIIVYLPIEEDTTLMFLNFTENIGTLNFRFLLPRKYIFNLARDKHSLNMFCLANGIPAPKLFEFSNYDSLKKNFIPIIAKPRVGSGAKGFLHIDEEKQLERIKKIINPDKYLLQEKLPNGRDVKGAFFLCVDGEVVSSYSHERIRTFPISGGVTVYSRIAENQDIIKIGSDLLKKLNWSGLVMIEFLWDDREKLYKVIEINPRLWGSILLSEFSNTSFLENYVNLSINKPHKESLISKDTKIRWLPFDIINWLSKDVKIKGFWKLNRKNTCYINLTYASVWSSFWYHLFFFFNINNLKLFIKKWKK